MPRLPTYRSRESAATPPQVGGRIGRAVSGLGRDIAGAAAIFQEKQRKDSVLRGNTAALEGNDEIFAALDEVSKSALPDGSDLMARTEQALQDGRDSYMARAQDDVMRGVLENSYNVSHRAFCEGTEA